MARSPRSLRSRAVFIDTSGYDAFLDIDDDCHEEALAIFHLLANARYRHITTNVVLIETHALLNSRVGSFQATQFLERAYQGQTEIVRASEADEERARAILSRYRDKDFSYADAISFAVMERLGLTYAVTFDSHFGQYGFVAVNSVQALP